MQTREEIGRDLLERYTGSKCEHFQKYILLTNFITYIKLFSKLISKSIHHGSAMTSCHYPEGNISIINFSLGSPNAALIAELLSFIKPQATILLGLCGGLRDEYKIGDFFNPVAAIRDEGTSDAFMPIRCPALSSFVIQRYVCEELENQNLNYHNGVIHTTNVRFWEFNEEFKQLLRKERVQAIDMEAATLFTVGYVNYPKIRS